jgi:hypothetical protein
MDELLAANLGVAAPALGQVFVVPNEGPLFTLPRNGEVFIGIDAHGHQARIWYERGQILSEAAFDVHWWRQQ